MENQKSNIKNQNDKSKMKNDAKIRAYYFSLSIIEFISSFPEKKVFWVIGDQLLRCSTSVGANIVEARASSSRRDFIKFIEIALKSANETKYWLCLLRDSKLTNQIQTKIQISDLLQEIIEISNMLGSSLLTLKGKK